MNYYLDYRTSETNTNISRNLIGELLLDLRYLRNKLYDALGLAVGELLPGLPYLRNGSTPGKAWAPGELLLGLRYFQNPLAPKLPRL